MEEIKVKPIEEVMKSSYMDYAMSVIIGRSLPDVRDGLKPVQRRILYSMHEMNLYHDKPFKKCARIVGEVMGKYHPHGESPIYEALVRMAQPFTYRYPLIEGQGNFGSIDGDAPAAMRYTEARLNKIAEEMLRDIDMETVPMMQNFDGTLEEPVYLPSGIPNLLINGSSGIAVGMATNIPPHNIRDVIDAIIYYIKNNNCSVDDLINIIKGPDFPTGGVILNYGGLLDAYRTGKGTIKVRGKYKIEEDKNSKSIVFTEIPYEVNKSELLQKISELIKEEKITGIVNIKDESNKDGIRVIFKLKRDANPEIVLNQLFEHSQLEVTYGIILLAVLDNVPKIFNLKDLISEYAKHRFNITKKRLEYKLKKDEEREHILSGLIKAIENIDEVIKIIKESSNPNEASLNLQKSFNLSEIQAKAILEMRLQRLTSMERDDIIREENNIVDEIRKIKDILSSDEKIYNLVIDELLEIEKRYGDERRTEIVKENVIRREEKDLIPPEDVIITLTERGYIKRVPINEYKTQSKGGKGVITEYGEDIPLQIIIANNRDKLLLFTNTGRVYSMDVYKLPIMSRKAIGKSINNFINLYEDEKIVYMIPYNENSRGYVLFLTKNGIVKKTPVEEFKNVISKGIIAIKLNNDILKDVKLIDDNDEIIISTKKGMVVRFDSREIRPMGRNAYGVVGIKIRNGDEVISMTNGTENSLLLTVTEKGKGKLTRMNEFRKTHRGSVGIKGQKVNDKTGDLVSVMVVDLNDLIMLQTKNGMTIAFKVNEIPIQGRNSQGIKLMNVDENDAVKTILKISSQII
ncbi:MAG: DNA gyrase subunit A [Thermoplasmata archaeon]